ncbi:efflux RND transporter periplasmic adaptor subunit [Thermodesulfobacteriota bacterium]
MGKIIVVLTALLALVFPAWGQEGLYVENATKEILLSGYTRSRTAVTLSAEVTGKVLRVRYDVGDIVGKELFLKIDPTFILYEIEMVKHGIRRLEIALKRSDSKIAYLEKEFNRIDRLFRENSTAETKQDAAEEELAQARLERMSTAVEKAVQETRLKELRERRRRHDIYAPAGWIITGRRVEEGEIIAPGTPLATVADYSRLVVPLSVSSAELEAIKLLPQEFSARLTGKPATAALNWINPEFDAESRKLAIEIEVRRFDGEKRGGLLFSLPLEIRAEGLRVPKAAVINRYDNPRVKLKKSGKEIKVIILGESNDHLLIAETDRLSPGMELVTHR